MNFFKTPDQYLEILKKNQSISYDFTQKCLESFYEINQINFDNCKNNLDNSNKFAGDLLNTKKPKDVSEITKNQLALFHDQNTDVCKSIYDTNSKLTKDLAELAEINLSEFNKFVTDSVSEFSKNAPAGSEGIVEMTKSSMAASSSTYDAMSSAAKQVLELVDNNMAVASKSSKGSKTSAHQTSPKSGRSRKAA